MALLREKFVLIFSAMLLLFHGKTKAIGNSTEEPVIVTDEPSSIYDLGSTSAFSTDIPPGEQFECKSEGNHPDSNVCEKFHICVEDGNGGFVDYPFDCQDKLVYCSETSRCEWPDVCPCKN